MSKVKQWYRRTIGGDPNRRWNRPQYKAGIRDRTSSYKLRRADEASGTLAGS